MNNQPTPLTQPRTVEEIQLHPQAEALAKEFTTGYGVLLIKQGQLLAARQRADEVQRFHIEEARNVLRNSDQRGWSRELFLILGGALFGAFIQGFIESLADHKTPLIVIYVIAGFIGMAMVFWALKQR